MIVFLFGTIYIGQSFEINNNIVEARSDYYIGHDSDEGCDAYIDVDSIVKHGYRNGGRLSEATVYWTNGRKTPNLCVFYRPSTGEYFFNGGAGPMYKPTGIKYRFSVICDRFAYES